MQIKLSVDFFSISYRAREGGGEGEEKEGERDILARLLFRRPSSAYWFTFFSFLYFFYSDA